jgi:hypothetical protein
MLYSPLDQHQNHHQHHHIPDFPEFSEDSNHLLNMITPVSMTPPPQPILDEMESIIMNACSPLYPPKNQISLSQLQTLYDGQQSKITAMEVWGELLVVGRKDGHVSVLRLDDGQQISSYQPETQQTVSKIATLNEHVLTISNDRFIVGYQLKEDKLTESFRLQTAGGAVQSLAIADQNRVVCCTSTGQVMLWVKNGSRDRCLFQVTKTVDTKQPGPNTVFQLAASSTTIVLAIGDELWILSTQELAVERKIRCSFQISQVSFELHHRYLLCLGTNMCALYDTSNDYSLLHTSPLFPDKVFSGAISVLKDGRQFAIFGSYQKLFTWVLDSSHIFTVTDNVHEGIVSCVKPYRDILLTAGHDGLVRSHKLLPDEAAV